MLLNNLRLRQKIKLGIVSKIFPVKETELILLDKLDIALRAVPVKQVDIPAISPSQITSNLCLTRLELVQYIAHIEAQQVDDLTIWLSGQTLHSIIESFDVYIGIPRTAGKSYGASEKVGRQIQLFQDIKDRYRTCVHGLKKGYCSVCLEKDRQYREKTAPRIDPFDLVFPILQPPLGENFDSPVAFPPGMELYPFQRDGIKFLAEHKRALLGDEMGLGKSIQAIVALRFLVRMGEIKKIIIICPKSVLTDWEKKLWDWAPELRLVKVSGPQEQRKLRWDTPAHVYLTTYETLRQDLSGSLNGDANGDIVRKQFDCVIADEIQKIKNPSAGITQATRQVDAPVRWGLSGTPLENRLEELVSIFAYLKPGLIRYDDALIPYKVSNAIKPYFLRRRKKDALPDLPEKVPEDVWLELSPAQRQAYDSAEHDGVIALNEKGDSITVQHILALITKLKQICNIDISSQESCKLEYLLDKLDELSEQDDKALVFSQYPERTLKLIEPQLKKFSPLVYHGSLSSSQRDDIVKDFQDNESNRVLLMSVKAGGLGITLTRANHVFHFDLWWNPSVADQAVGRVDRIGQKKTVFVTTLYTVNTIEERIAALLERKRKLFKEVIDDLSDTNLSRVLSEDELFGLFGLRKTKSKTLPASVSEVTTESLAKVSPQQFEKMVADLFTRMGYFVKLTPLTKDGGVDVYAKRSNESGTESLAIQCKHYPNGVVGVEAARSLYGVIQDDPSITRGFLVTSGEFSRECKEFVRGKRIQLFDGTYLEGLFKEHNVTTPHT